VLAGFGRPCVVAGTGGFAGLWASSLSVSRGWKAPEPRVERCLVISGSLHPASREQVRRGEADGIRTAYLMGECEADSTVAQKLEAALQAQGWAALATPGSCPPGIGERIGALVRRVLDAGLADCLVIFGGDTAFAVLRSIGVAVLESAGELMPGVPLSLARYQGRALALVTKAGGFGGADVLLSIKEILEKKR